MSLLDYPDKVCATFFTGGCNLRCPFCHNTQLVTLQPPPVAIPPGEVMAFLRNRQGLLDGICVSGGEPLLQYDLEEFLARVKQLGYLVKLDTNGSQPAKLRRMVEAQLVDYVAMDIKSSLESYDVAVGIEDYGTAPIEESAAFLLQGTVPYEFRTTVVFPLHNSGDFEAIGSWLKGAERYYLQGFEDSGDLLQPNAGLAAFSTEEMQHFVDILKKTIPSVQLRGI